MINCYVYLFLLVFLYSLCSVSFPCFCVWLFPIGSHTVLHTDPARLASFSVAVVVFLFIQNLITTYLLSCVCRC